jgi:hypothetical protein
VSAVPAHYADLGERRDTLLAPEWERTRRIIGAYAPGDDALQRARRLAEDPEAMQAEIRDQMGLARARTPSAVSR